MSPRTYLIIAFVLMLAVACGPGTDETSESQPSAAQDSAPTFTPTPDTGVVVLEGNGNQTSSVVLDEGQWSVDMTVQDNEDCSSGSCIESKFTVEIESESGKALVVPAERDHGRLEWKRDRWRGKRVGGLDPWHSKSDRHRNRPVDNQVLAEIDRTRHTTTA